MDVINSLRYSIKEKLIILKKEPDINAPGNLRNNKVDVIA